MTPFCSDIQKEPLIGKLAVSIRFIILLLIFKLSSEAQTTAGALWAFNKNTLAITRGREAHLFPTFFVQRSRAMKDQAVC